MVNKKIGLIFGTAIIFLFALSLISASLSVFQPNSVYNLGDDISINVKIDAITEGYLDVNLVCSGSLANIYHNVPEETEIKITRKLTETYIGNLSGSCYLSANYNSQFVSSQSFQVSNEFVINLPISEITAEAGKKIQLKGTLLKQNTQPVLNADIYVILNENVSSSGIVNDGQFTVDFNIPETTHAGAYSLQIRAETKNSNGGILNSAETSARLIVTQKAEKLEIALDKTSLNPEENITIIPSIYDMADDVMTGQIILKMSDSAGNKIYESLVSSQQQLIYIVKSNTLPGYVTISAEKENISAEKIFQVNELRKINAEIKDSKILITNVGNVPYKGPVQITIGGENFIQDLDLGYGMEKSFDISAPDGTYDVKVNDGSEVLNRGGISLTGNVISLRESGARVSDFMAKYPIVWIFIAAILILWAWVSYKRYMHNRRISSGFVGRNKEKSEEIKKKGGVEIVNTTRVMERIVSGQDIKKAEQVMVLHGRKQPVSVIAIKIKNDTAGISEESINKALDYAYQKKAVSYQSGDNLIVLFSPLITGKQDNEETAIKVAMEIDGILKEHNRKFRNDLIDYGIGVNSGEIVNKITGQVLQFANINKTISIAKKIADMAHNESLLSKEIRDKTANSVKAEKVATGAMDLFSVKRVVDTKQSEKFINEFLRRNTHK
jgi:hypothetical protein